MAEITLYHWEPNANSGKPMLALMEKGVAFQSHYLDLLQFDQHKPEYLAIKTPNIMRWLKRVYTRPAVQKTWAMGKTDLAARYGLIMEGIS